MIKSIYFFTAILLIVHTVSGQEKSLSAELKTATVFLNQAQLSSEASTTLEAGVSELFFEGLPKSVDPRSIQVSGKGGFTILGVSYEENYQQPIQPSREHARLRDSLKFYEFQLTTFKDFEEVMRKEEQMLVANQTIGGKNAPLDTDDLEYFAEFFRKRLLDIRFQILKNSRDIETMTANVQRIKNQLAVLKTGAGPSGRIKVTVSAPARTNAVFELNYVISDASWHPIYDLRVKEVGEPVTVACKAMVYQYTGVEWKNVKLTLSTGNPSIGGQKPELNPWYLSIYQPAPPAKAAPVAAQKEKRVSMAMAMDNMAEMEASGLASRTTAVETALAVEYAIGVPYSVPSSSQGRLVDIQNLSLQAEYRHFTIPKLSESAYLIARVSDYDDKNLISGKANVYFEGSYVGETYLNLNTTEDTLEFGLGIDKNVVVKRESLKEFRSKKLLSTARSEEFAYRISVRNSKKNPIRVIIQDQVPVSRDSQIKIDAQDISGARKTDTTGLLEWDKTIPGGQTTSIDFRYSVEFPKNKQVNGLR